MTNALMEVETLDDWQVENIMQGRHFNDNFGQIEFKAIQDEKDKQALISKEKDKKEEDPAFVPDVAIS